MAIEFLRYEKCNDELRTYFAGVDGDGEADVQYASGMEYGARFFWFQFQGQKYRAFSHVYLRVMQAGVTR